MEMADRVQRTGSFIEPDPQEQLLKAFQKRNHDKFVSILGAGDINIDHYYGDPENGTLIDLCTTQENSTQFLRTLLTHGADPNILNRLRKKAPLHFILESNDLKNLATILEFPKTDVNITDSFGNTPLHYAAKGPKKGASDTIALQRLLSVSNIDVNAVNRKGQTPAHLAASQKNKDALLLLVRRDDIDLQSSEDFSGQCALDLIRENYPDIFIPEKPLFSMPQTVTPAFVFSLLRANNTERFKKALEENKDLVDASDGFYTLLQHACDHGLFDEASFLIESGADINITSKSMQYTPIMLASRKGYYRIVKRLINLYKDTKTDIDVLYSPVNMETVYHCVVIGSDENSQLGDSEEGRDHLECLNILLAYSSKWESINRGDSKGNTPLHYAGKIGNDEMVFRLLEAGAYAGCVNVFGYPALSYISPTIFEKYLDRCVTSNEKLPREDTYEIIINYKCFVPPNERSENLQNYRQHSSRNLNETDLLLYTSKSPDLKPLLMHPVLKSLIHMKWFNIRKWFYVNLLFYLFFWALLTAYILGVYDTGESFKNLNSNKTNTDNNAENIKESKSFIWYLVTLLLALFIVRELFQFKKAYIQYLSNPENWLEMGLILLTIIILFINVDDETKHQLAASAILFSWTELVLLIGKHPALSIHIEMLKTVGWNFLKFLAWYSILIVAFALSFYTLFRNGRDEDEDNQVFIGPGVSVFKTIVMLTGEFEAGEIPFDRYPITSHLLFVLFVFAIAIVLYNLLNGLAVSDTQAIKADAEMVGYVSRIKLVSYVETIDLLSCKNLFTNFKRCNFTKGNLTCDKTVFTFTVDHEIRIFPNDRNRIEFPSAPAKANLDVRCCCLLQPCNCKETMMDSTIVKSAQILLVKRKEGSESYMDFNRFNYNDKLLDEYRKTLNEYKSVLSQIKSLTDSLKPLDKVSIQNDFGNEL